MEVSGLKKAGIRSIEEAVSRFTYAVRDSWKLARRDGQMSNLIDSDDASFLRAPLNPNERDRLLQVCLPSSGGQFSAI